MNCKRTANEPQKKRKKNRKNSEYVTQINRKKSANIPQNFSKYSAKRRIIFGVILWTFLLIKVKVPFNNHHIDDYFLSILSNNCQYAHFLTIISLRVFTKVPTLYRLRSISVIGFTPSQKAIKTRHQQVTRTPSLE